MSHNPTRTAILDALTQATGLPETSFTFSYPPQRLRLPQHDGWTTAVDVSTDTPMPDPALIATALGRPASCIQLEQVGALWFLTFHDTTPTYLQAA